MSFKSALPDTDDPYRAGNTRAACAVLEDPARHGGEGAGLVQWARLYLAQHGRPAAEGSPGTRPRAEAGTPPLFEVTTC